MSFNTSNSTSNSNSTNNDNGTNNGNGTSNGNGTNNGNGTSNGNGTNTGTNNGASSNTGTNVGPITGATTGTKHAGPSRLSRKELYWILYDVGNSAFILLVSTLLPIYFNYLAESEQLSPTQYFSLWGMATSAVTLIVAVLAPVTGAFSDLRHMKKPVFAVSVILGCIACFCMGLTSSWLVFLIIFILAKICYSGSLIFYDSMLSDITTPERMDSISSHGYAWGYIGSCLPFLCTLLISLHYEQLGLSFPTAMMINLGIIALWWLGFSLPLLKVYHQLHFVAPEKHMLRGSVRRTWQTLKDIRNEKHIFLFLLAFFFYIDGVYTIIDMATAYGKSIGLDSNLLLIALLLTQIVAFPFAILFGVLAKRVPSTRLLSVCILAYTGIALFAIQLDTGFEFFVLAVCVGMFQGGIQALSRSFYAKIIPPEKSGEYFGLFDICGKGASFLGTMLVSFVGTITQRVNYGVSSLSIIFVIGLLLFLSSAKEVERRRLRGGV